MPPRLPGLMLSGTLDSLTPRRGGATLVTQQLGPSARLVTLANLTHVAGQDANNGCALSIYRQFVRNPAGLATQDTSCAARITPVHTVGSYPLRLAGVRWVTDATVSGTAWWDQASGWVTARLTVRPVHGTVIRLTARWRPFGAAGQLATVTGSQGRRRLAAAAPAP